MTAMPETGIKLSRFAIMTIVITTFLALGCGADNSSNRTGIRQGSRPDGTGKPGDKDDEKSGDSSSGGNRPDSQDGTENDPDDRPSGDSLPDDTSTDGNGSGDPSTGTDTVTGDETNSTDGTQPVLSGGSGGLAPGDYTDLPVTIDGLSTTYHLYVPPGEGYGVIVYLHGDGGGGYSSNYKGRMKSVRQIAEERRLLAINVKSPYRMGDGSPSWRSGNTANSAKLLHGLIQEEIYKKYPVDKSRFFITGNSGGPTFISSVFVPSYGMNYIGGAIPVCGGVAPSKNALQPTPEFIKNFKMYFYVETGDFMYQYAPRAVQRYRDAGFEVTAVHPAESGHCELDMYEVLTDALDTIDR